jgi:hypothetical protein
MADKFFNERYNCPVIERLVTVSGTYHGTEIEQSMMPVKRNLFRFDCDHLRTECPFGKNQPSIVEEKCPAYLTKKSAEF